MNNVQANEYPRGDVPINKASIKTTRDFPWLYRGNVYVSSGRFMTDRQYNRFLKKARRIKLKK